MAVLNAEKGCASVSLKTVFICVLFGSAIASNVGEGRGRNVEGIVIDITNCFVPLIQYGVVAIDFYSCYGVKSTGAITQ